MAVMRQRHKNYSRRCRRELFYRVWSGGVIEITEFIMAAERLAKIPEADIDQNGVFKYVLIRVHSETDESYVDVVRGYAWAEYHGTELRALQPSFCTLNKPCIPTEQF